MDVVDQIDEHVEPDATAQRPDWLPFEEYPFELRTMHIDGQTVAYVDEGEGPVLLFVHAGMWSFVWRDLIVRLREGFRCVAIDFPGSGLSGPAPGSEPSLDAASQTLESIVRRLDLQAFTLVLHDLGGPVAFGMAARFPERVRGIAITESFGWPLSRENPDVARMLRIVGGRTFGAVDTLTNLLMRATSTSSGVGRNLARAGRRAFRGPSRDRKVRANTPALLGAAARSDDYLEAVERTVTTALADRPTLLVFGSKSPTVKEGFPERWQARLPKAQLVMVDGGHHFPMMDDPGLVAEAIAGWWGDEVGVSGID